MTTEPPQARPGDLRYSSWHRQQSLLRTAAARYIRGLYAGYRDDRPQAVATLARLRRGLGQPLHTQPDLWGLIGMDSFQRALDESSEQSYIDYWNRPRTLDRVETALHLTLTLWALHQQAHREAPMHADSWGLGCSVRHLMRIKTGARSGRATGTASTGGEEDAAWRTEENIDEPLRKRFVKTAAATSFDVMAQRLRELVLLFRSADVPLDYGMLAHQFLRWQEPGGRAEVHRSWGRDFHLAGLQRRPATGPDRTEDADAPDGRPGYPDDRNPSAD